MFGDMMGMMGKLKETQQKIEEAKARLNHVLVDEIAADGSVKEALLEDKEALEDYLIITLNKAIAKATELNELELANVAKQGLPFNF